MFFVPEEVHLSGWLEVCIWLVVIFLFVGVVVSREAKMSGGFLAAALICTIVIIVSLPTGEDKTNWSRFQGWLLIALMIICPILGAIRRRRE